MMPVTSFVKPSTPVSTASPATATNNATAVQSGPYTKAQFLNTMEGSRSVKNIKEIEQLLRDYPAALELYRTKRYKVKVKYEADVERVILVEKRSSKNASSNAAKNADLQQSKQSVHETSNDANPIKSESKRAKDSGKVRSRTHSRDRVVPTASATENADATTAVVPTSSNQAADNAPAQSDVSRRASKDRESLANSQSKQEQHSLSRRDRSHDSRSITSHSKSKGKKHSRDYATALVPYVPNANPAANVWPQSRALQPYYNNAMFPHPQQYPPNYYMPPALMHQQNQIYQQPYYYPPQQPAYPMPYQQQPAYPVASQSKSAGNNVNPALRSAHNYQQSPRNMYNQNHAPNLPPAFHTFHPAQQYYQHPQAALYPQQPVPFQMPGTWPAANNVLGHPIVNTNQPNVDSRRSSKHRAYSVDMGPGGVPPVSNYPQPQQQSAATVMEQHYHHHRHHHHRSHPTDAQAQTVVPPVDVAKQSNVLPTNVPAPVNNESGNEKLTIRQLNEIFVQMDPSGRVGYNAVPVVLQRYGMNLAENDLLSAAQDLKYNVAEPISARRLVHVLVKLGKIAKSNNQQRPQPAAHPQQQSLASPAMLPEDREVTDIMTQRRATGVASTHIHSSVYPNHWY